MKHPAAPLLAADFGRLQHTNTQGQVGILHLPGFMAAGMSDEQAAETIGTLAVGLAEAIIETLEVRHGYLVIHRDELEEQARTMAADNAADNDGIPIHCNRCRQVVISRLRVSDWVKIHVPTVMAALQAHVEDCR